MRSDMDHTVLPANYTRGGVKRDENGILCGRKSRGGTTTPRIWSGGRDANGNSPSIYCHASKFQVPDCLQYNAVKTVPTTP